jgi:hypothetical protein
VPQHVAQARRRQLRQRRASGCLSHVARLVTQLVVPLVVDYSTSGRLVVD